VDPAAGSFALPERLERGSRLVFVCLDPATGRADLAHKLDGLTASPASFGCYLSCPSRSAQLFGHAGIESGYLERALHPLPVLGGMGAYQLAPAARGGATELHTYSGVLVLVDA
jgi:small ligand-binding sensory domain FIST